MTHQNNSKKSSCGIVIPPARSLIPRSRCKNLSLIAAAVLFSFVGSSAQAEVTFKGTASVNGEIVEVPSKSDSISIGQAGDIVEVKTDESNTFYVNPGNLTIDGLSITVDNKNISAISIQKADSTAIIGSVNTNYVNLNGYKNGVSANSGSSLTIDSSNEIHIGTIGSDEDSTLNSILSSGTSSAPGAKVSVGEHAKYIYLQTESSASSTSEATGIKALSKGNVFLGSDNAEQIRISAYSAKETYGLWSVGKTDRTTSLIEVKGKRINIISRAKKEARGLNAEHGGDIHINGGTLTITAESTETISTSETSFKAYGIVGQSELNDLSEVSINALSIISTATANIQAVGIYSGTNSVLNIGSNESDSVVINAISKQGTDSSFAYGLWVDNTAKWEKNGGKLDIKGKTVSIYAEGANDTRAIHVASNDLNPVARSQLNLTADNIFIEAKSTDPNKRTAGISAMSAGNVFVTGNTVITADNAIQARGDAHVVINKDGQHATQINGDIVFTYDAATSGTDIDAVVDITLAGENSYLEGQSMRAGDPPAEKSDVDNFSIRMIQGGAWRVTGDSFVNAMSLEDAGAVVLQEKAQSFTADDLSVNGGIIRTTKSTQTLAVDQLQIGNDGAIIDAASSLNDDGSISSATLSVNSLLRTPDNVPAAIQINYTNITSDDLSAENTKTLNALAGEGLNGAKLETIETVEEGDINGSWMRKTTAEGVSTVAYSENTKLADYSSVNAMSLVQWRSEINHLTKRLGDIRSSQSAVGAWARVYGGASEWGDNAKVEMDHTTIQVGGDYRINPSWIIGAAFSYTDSEADLVNGQADGESYSLAAYATYMAEGGSYLDMIARYGYLKNDISAGNMDLDTDNNALSISLETGHTFRFLDERAYIEPQIELTYGFVAGDAATASNDVHIEQDDYQNLITRLGIRTGFDFPENAGTFYAMLSYSYDFLGDADGTASKRGVQTSLGEDLGGSWVSYGIGAQFRLGDNAFAYGELERTSGGEVDNPYLFNVGFRYNF